MKSFLLNASLQSKLLIIGVAIPAVIIAALLYFYSSEAKEKAVLSGVDKARSICLAAESAREQTENQWASGIFSTKTLTDWGKENEMGKVMSTIPVVTAWETAMNKAKEGGYQFSVPALEPRNPDNQPNELQRKALETIRNKKLTEYHVVNKETNSVHYFRPVYLGKSCLNCHGDPANSMALWGTDNGEDVTGHAMENWEEGRMHGAFEVIQSLDEATESANASIYFAIFAAVGALVLAGIITVLTTRNITAKIGNAIGVISNYVSNLRTSAEDLSRQSNDTSDQTSVMESTINDVSENMTSVSTAMVEMGSAIDEIAQRSEEASRVAGTAVDETENTKSVMDRLGQSCSKIDDVVSLINSLAEQTNLLALNATIEAARAGEAGKGFAVVANEVKELASQTGEATGGISDVINSIHTDTADAVSSVEKIHGIISEINMSQQAIATAVTEQSATTQSISDNLSEVSKSSTDIAERIKHISGSTSQTSEQVSKSTQLVAEIESTAKKVPEMIGV